MKQKWTSDLDNSTVELECIPETVLDARQIEGLGTVEVAKVRRNGTLKVIFEVPKTPIQKPTTPRGADDVRDQ